MTRYRHWIALLLFVFAVSPLAVNAQTNPVAEPVRPLDLQQKLKTGERITVRLKDGRLLKGPVLAVTDTELSISTKNGSEKIAAPLIREVTSRQPDKVWNGLIIGALTGALMGALANFANDCDRNECGEVFVVPGGAAIGALVGSGIDLLWRPKQVLYRAGTGTPSGFHVQLLAGKASGAGVTWRF